MAVTTEGVRPLRPGELAAAAGMLARAFDDDPLFRDLLPDDRRRAEVLRWFLRSSLNECSGVSGGFTLAAGPEVGAMAIVPPGMWPLPLRRTLRAIALPRFVPTLRLVRQALHIEARIRAMHPAGPHVYVNLLGVDPTMKGRGHGATLMRHACAIAREAGSGVYLETSNPKNLTFYRRWGLEVVAEIASHGAAPIWTMATARLPTE
jgi:ribosomal protein S18 acetylase RimI-like enzyme